MSTGMSIEQFCLKNKVPYNLFNKWYKDTRKKIVEMYVDGKPCQTGQAPTSQHGEAKPQTEKSSVRILLELRMTNGLHISQKNLSYQELQRLVEKLEGLC